METTVALTAYHHPSAWTGADMAQRTDWLVHLSDADNAELRAALSHARARGVDVPALASADFPLPMLAPRLQGITREVMQGRGFVLMRGFQIDDLPAQDAALIYWGIGSHMGRGRAQNAQGDMLGHVTDIGLDYTANANARGYQTRQHLPFHNDTQDIVGLLCLHPARRGGLSRLVSSTAIYNAVLQRRPDLLSELCAPWHIDRRGETPAGKPPYYMGAMFEFSSTGRLYCRYNRVYIESARRLPGVPALTSRQIEALDLMDALCSEPGMYLDMELQKGDMQFINNYTVLHSRTDYEDWPERERRRYLLRLWLETGIADDLPTAYADRYGDTLLWRENPQPPVFDLSLRREELAH